jgi:hypothetical protein
MSYQDVVELVLENRYDNWNRSEARMFARILAKELVRRWGNGLTVDIVLTELQSTI